MYITNNPQVALIAEKYGVDRIWVDLETLGKEERQKGYDSVKSHHSIQDIGVIAPLLSKSEMLVRINPWHDGSTEELEAVIAQGAQRIMLPMWKSPQEVKAFLSVINRRVKNVLLLETKEAVECLDEVLTIPGIDEIHIGLNDLHLFYGLTFMFELLADGTVEKLCAKISKAGIPYGFGGIARLGQGLLPAQKVIMEHHRLGSTRVILSRSFCNVEQCKDITEVEQCFRENMLSLREYEKYCYNIDESTMQANRLAVVKAVEQIVEGIRSKTHV